ncbi:unnamed protein product, partial [Allacma fusca]
DTLSI